MSSRWQQIYTKLMEPISKFWIETHALCVPKRLHIILWLLRSRKYKVWKFMFNVPGKDCKSRLDCKIRSIRQSNPQSNPLFWNGFQIWVQSTKKECNPDFAILQWQSCRCLHIYNYRVHIFTSAKNWMKYQGYKKTKNLYNHKNCYEKVKSTQMKHVVLLTQRND